MRAVIQRVSEASVTVEGQVMGRIRNGLLILLAIHKEDTDEQLRWMANKCLKLRIFEDDQGKMNRSVEDINGGILLVSQFTLYGELKKGTRPSFTKSAGPEKAEAMYEGMISLLEESMPGKIQTGVFAAKMDVALVNDGPVTVIVER